MKSLAFFTAGIILFTGCSVMPYHNNFSCQGGSNVKICKRVSDVLEESDDINNPQQTQTTKVKLIKCPYNTFYPYYKPFKKCINRENTVLQENKKLKNMIEAISLEELQNPVKVEIECKNLQNQHKSYIPLNKQVKVCVYEANIRKEPSCKADIVKVVKKGTMLFAKALINNTWIKVKNGYIHKSLICGKCKGVK